MSDTRTPAEILRAAKSKITDRRHWTHGWAARDRHSHHVPPTDERAVRWCGSGAVICAAADVPETTRDSAWDYIERVLAPGDSLQWINDRHGHQAVLDVLSKAITLAEAAQ